MGHEELSKETLPGLWENLMKTTEDLEHEEIEDKYKKKGMRTQILKVF